MAGSFDLLFVQDFSSSASVVVTHNLDLFQVGVRVIVGGQVRQDLIDSIEYTVGDPRNELTVNLSSAQTGTIQIVNNDVSWANFSTPANASMIGAGALEIKAGNTLYVDAVNGDNATALVGRFDKPYLTIAAAIAAASANDLVLVRPGTYDETSLVLPNGVTLAGIDRLRCIIYHQTIDTTTIVTMGQNTSLENMTIRGASPPASGRNLVEFPGTTANSSVARNLVLEGRAGNVNGLSISGTGVSAQNWVTCDMVDVKGVGLSNGLISSTTGFFIVRDCLLAGLVGCNVSSGNVELQDTKCSGVVGLIIAAGATVYVNQSTRWIGSTTSLQNSGSLVSSGKFLVEANIAQYLRSSNQLITTTASPIIFDTSNFEDSNYSRTGELITILTAGVYQISYSVFFDTNSNSRKTVECWCDRSTNGGASFAQIIPSRAASYARNNTDDTSNTTTTFFVELGVNDIVRLIADSTGTAGGTPNGIGNRMWISLQYLRA